MNGTRLKRRASNQQKHGIGFDDAEQVFYDPYAVMEQDRVLDGEERWRTIGFAGEPLLLYVAHMFEERSSDEIIRIISARPATKRERKRYGQNRSKGLG